MFEKTMTIDEIKSAHSEAHEKTSEHPLDFFEAREGQIETYWVIKDPTSSFDEKFLFLFSYREDDRPPYKQYRVARFNARTSEIKVMVGVRKNVAVKFVKHYKPVYHPEILDYMKKDLHLWKTGKKIYG